VKIAKSVLLSTAPTSDHHAWVGRARPQSFIGGISEKLSVGSSGHVLKIKRCCRSLSRNASFRAVNVRVSAI